MLKHAGVLPWARTPNGPVFLLGRERSSKRWSSFGGRPEEGETILETAIREAWEESIGFLGSEQDIAQQINQYVADITLETVVFSMEIQYQPDLPEVYNRVHECTLSQIVDSVKRYNKITRSHVRGKPGRPAWGVPLSTPVGTHEKVELRWFSLDEILRIPLRKSNAGTVKRLTNKIASLDASRK